MGIYKRKFIALVAGVFVLVAITVTPLINISLASSNNTKIKAIVFDAFPIFDPRPAFKVVKEQFPKHGDELRKLWFSKIFSYTWLRTSGKQYKDFQGVMIDALQFSASSMKLKLTPEKQRIIMDSFLHLPVWNDVKPALEKLKGQNIRLGFLSNMTEEMLRANMQYNGIEEYFEFVLSTDRAQAFKPSPQSYRLGTDAFGLAKEEILFTAFAGWDAAGASWFGYPTIWVNRLGFPEESLDANIAYTGKGMEALEIFVGKSNRREAE